MNCWSYAMKKIVHTDFIHTGLQASGFEVGTAWAPDAWGSLCWFVFQGIFRWFDRVHVVRPSVLHGLGRPGCREDWPCYAGCHQAFWFCSWNHSWRLCRWCWKKHLPRIWLCWECREGDRSVVPWGCHFMDQSLFVLDLWELNWLLVWFNLHARLFQFGSS